MMRFSHIFAVSVVMWLSLVCLRGCLWSFCEVVGVLYVDAVVAVTVMCVLLFVLHLCKL